MTPERLAEVERIERIRASQAGVVQPDETVLFLLAEVERLTAERDAARFAIDQMAPERRARDDVTARLRHEVITLTAALDERSTFSYAEAQRFVCEAQEQRGRADRAQADLADVMVRFGNAVERAVQTKIERDAAEARADALVAERDAARKLGAYTARKFTQQLEANLELLAERDALAVSCAEMRAVLSDAIDAHTRDDVLARAQALLATDPAERGASLLAAAEAMAEAIEAGLGYVPMKAAVRTGWRALVQRTGGEGT